MRLRNATLSLATLLTVFVVCGTAGLPLARAAAEKPAAERAEGSAHAGESSEAAAPDPLSVDIDLAVCTFIVFAVLLAVLWKFAWGPIAEGLDRREKGIADNIEAAERSFREAKEVLAQYEKKLAGANDQIRGLLDQARRDSESARQEILAEAKASASQERDRTLLEISRATDRALKELSEKSADIAVELAGKIVRTKLTPAEQTQLVSDAMAKFTSAAPSTN